MVEHCFGLVSCGDVGTAVLAELVFSPEHFFMLSLDSSFCRGQLAL